MTFQRISDGGHHALVKFGLESLNVPLDELSPQQPPKLEPWQLPPPVFKPAPPPSDAAIAERLASRRQALKRAHEAASASQDAVAAALSVCHRADQEVTNARATLRTLDAHTAADQKNYEEAIELGRPLPQRSNGTDRSYLLDRVTAAETAKARFDQELATARSAMADRLQQVRRAAAQVLAALLEKETASLVALEARAAVLRAELNAVGGLWLSADLGPLQIDRATALAIEEAVHWRDQPLVRQGGSDARLRPWRSLYDRLVDGDAMADFSLDPHA